MHVPKTSREQVIEYLTTKPCPSSLLCPYRVPIESEDELCEVCEAMLGLASDKMHAQISQWLELHASRSLEGDS